MTQLTPHFTFEELTHTDHRTLDNTPTEREKCIINGQEVYVNAVANLPRLANFLEQVKVVLGNKPIRLPSKVDLPAPLGPITVITLPFSACRFRPCSTSALP